MSIKDNGAMASLSDGWKIGIWTAFVTAMSVLFSWALACAAPFVAIAAIAALTLSRANAFLLVGVTFVINQAIGFLLLGYPTTAESFGWGAAIGVAAFAATFVTTAAMRKTDDLRVAGAMGFLGGFVAYELVLIASTMVLPAGGGFSLAVIGEIFWINALAFAGLLAFRWLGQTIGLLAADDRQVLAA
ncbi:hypothetical protein [Methyloligella solikamskensis]|uniref:Uncharacterized protein n=1 Tax=Methyloligella solikamskensis TaxID=1177756 RepID=A0ABW3J975_9HYPH